MDERFRRLKSIDTPTITNVVASYPDNHEVCMGIYNPWRCNWYTDETCKCMFPELGPKAGYAVTAVVGEADPSFSRLSNVDLFKAVEASPKPVIVVVHQGMDKKLKRKNGMYGGIMTTALKNLGCVGCVSDGPSRDLNEIRGLDFQYLLTGVAAGHGNFAIYAVNIPVSVCGMDVAPGEIVHMDENGAVKFPAERIDDILMRAEKLIESETKIIQKIKEAASGDEIAKIMSGFTDMKNND